MVMASARLMVARALTVRPLSLAPPFRMPRLYMALTSFSAQSGMEAASTKGSSTLAYWVRSRSIHRATIAKNSARVMFFSG